MGRIILLLATVLAGCVIEDDSEYALRLDAMLDASDVSFATALRVPDRALPDSWLLAGELDAYSGIFEADLWDGESLLHAEVDLDGTLLDVDELGWDPKADAVVDVVVEGEISLYDAISTAEEELDDARAFAVRIDGELFEVAVLSHLRIYDVWISPRDGRVVDVDRETNGHHGCPCW